MFSSSLIARFEIDVSQGCTQAVCGLQAGTQTCCADASQCIVDGSGAASCTFPTPPLAWPFSLLVSDCDAGCTNYTCGTNKKVCCVNANRCLVDANGDGSCTVSYSDLSSSLLCSPSSLSLLPALPLRRRRLSSGGLWHQYQGVLHGYLQ